MKKIFRKAITVLGSAALIGATVGAAAAASYPDPFTSNTAIVVGANAAPSDNIAASQIASDLNANSAGSSGTTLSGGESFTLDKSSTHFNVGDALNSVYSTLDAEDMDFLADGSYDNGDVDEEYEQTIALSTKTLGLFADSDYNDDEPTLGFKWTNGQNILNYTLKLDDEVTFANMNGSDMPLLGNDYYVLESEQNKITLLDSADSAIVADGESITVAGKTVSIEFIDSSGVKFNVNGEITDKMTEGGIEELNDGSFIVMTELLSSSRETTVQKAEIAIGAGKIILENNKEIIIGEDSNDEIDGLKAHFVSGTATGVTELKIAWNSYRETFLTENDPIEMPGLGVIGLNFGGLSSDESEMITISSGEAIVIEMDNYDFALAENVSGGVVSGEEDYPLVLATGAANYTASYQGTQNNTGGLNVTEKDRFIVTYIGTDLSDVETLYYEVATVEDDSGTIEVVLEDMISDNDLTFDDIETHDRGVITVELDAVDNATTPGYAYLNFSKTGSGTLYYDRLVSDTGLIIDLPTVAQIEAIDTTTGADIVFIEADDEDDIGEGTSFKATLKTTANEKLHVASTNVTEEEISDDKYTGTVDSSLATVVNSDESGDEYELEIEYFGEEVTAEVNVVAGGEATDAPGEAGVMTVKDTEVSTVAGKNLIVVGGSAINSVAAELIGNAFSEGDFTDATGIAAGEALIASYDRSGKTALLIAGYNAADTEKAVTYLLNEDVDTSVGTNLKVTDINTATAM